MLLIDDDCNKLQKPSMSASVTHFIGNAIPKYKSTQYNGLVPLNIKHKKYIINLNNLIILLKNFCSKKISHMIEKKVVKIKLLRKTRKGRSSGSTNMVKMQVNGVKGHMEQT